MLDFVSPAFDELARGHKRGHVATYPQSSRMRMVRDGRNQLRFDGRINLNLGVAVVSVPIDVLNRLLGGVHPHLRRTRELACAVDNTDFQNARPELGAGVETDDALKK